MATDETQKLDAIIGSAIRGLVDAGADDSSIGAFAANHRQRVAEILGLAPASPQADSLEAVIADAVTRALTDAGVISTNKRDTSKRMNVVVRGKRTSVTLGRQLLQRLIESKGSPLEARRFVEEITNRAPPAEENRSRWVQERLSAFLAGSPGTNGNDARH